MIQAIIKKLFFGLCLMLICNISVAELYRWEDAQGKAHFSDKKPSQRKVETMQLRKNPATKKVVNTENIDTEKQVVMYSTAWCGYCRKARNYFRKNAIQFTEYDIEKDRAANTRHKNLGGTGVPLILVGKKKMHGFSAARFDKIYQ